MDLELDDDRVIRLARWCTSKSAVQVLLAYIPTGVRLQADASCFFARILLFRFFILYSTYVF